MHNGLLPEYPAAHRLAEAEPVEDTTLDATAGTPHWVGPDDSATPGEARAFQPYYAEDEPGPAAGSADQAPPDSTPQEQDATAEALAAEARATLHAVQVAQAVQTLLEEARAERRRLDARLTEAIAGVAKAAISRDLSASFLDEVAFATDRLSEALPDPRCTLRARDDDCPALREALTSQGQAGVDVTADPDLAPGEIRLTWADGGADFDLERLMVASAQLFDRLLAQARIPTAPLQEEVEDDRHERTA